ncbi:MAG: IS5 family transposase [Coleofasciculaceae cyanobacterium SM2_3_26]|nr:IS5 family transposase [Coleofasciculaceae cyanobacterium SM2_3_26]
MGQLGFWDEQKRQEYLEQKHNLLVQLNRLVPWEEFRPLLEQVHQKERKSNAGRKPIDPVQMFKLLILQKLYNISDEQLEYQVNDRLSFMGFLGLGIEDKVPDATTVWLFRQRLVELGLVEQLFEQFDEYLRGHGYQAEEGQVMDATLVPAPKQHNTKEENEQLKQGEIPEAWKQKPHKLSQKDTDARWTKKNNQSHFGYKNHVSMDVKHGLVRCYEVTDASVHDSQTLPHLLDGHNTGDEVWADSTYQSQEAERILGLIGFESHIHERTYRHRPLSQEQKQQNRERSRTRAKVEHIFGAWVNSMGGKLVRAIGQARVKAHIGLKNLAYNLRRYVFLQTQCA